jgi:hypothetical protein
VGVSFPQKFKFNIENFKLVSQRKIKPLVVRPVTIVNGVGGVALENGGVEVQSELGF